MFAGAGGAAFGASSTAGACGVAISSATGAGEGSTYVYSSGIGGEGGLGSDRAVAGLGGNGFATAIGTGDSGFVSTIAEVGTSQGHLVNHLRAAATGQLVGTVVSNASAQFSAAGFGTGEAAGGTDSRSFKVSADTSTAGTYTGVVAVDFESNGQEWSLGLNIGLDSQMLAVNTSAFAEAAAEVMPSVDFATARKGTIASSSIFVSNAGNGALVDQLRETSRAVDVAFLVDAMTGDVTAGDSVRLASGWTPRWQAFSLAQLTSAMPAIMNS